MESRKPRFHWTKSLTATAVLVLVIVAATSSAAIAIFEIGNNGTKSPYHPNVRLSCKAGLFLANHHCVPECPAGFHPVSYDAGIGPLCMTYTGEPVSIYDLSGLVVSANGGVLVYLIVPDVPLTKILVTGADNFYVQVFLSVSPYVLGQITTGPTYSHWTLPRTTTEVAAIGDTAGSFQVLKINGNSVEGLYSYVYPLCCPSENRTIRIGDDVGIACEGWSEKLANIDYSDRVVIFTKTVQAARGVCPICLSGDTFIETPNGPFRVTQLTVRMPVWTVNTLGQKVSAPILEVRRTQVLSTHEMIHILLEDGRQLYVSPGHPTADGRMFGELMVGNLLDGSHVEIAELVPYDQSYTYDLLPAGDTGFYWANGILTASTMK